MKDGGAKKEEDWWNGVKIYPKKNVLQLKELFHGKKITIYSDVSQKDKFITCDCKLDGNSSGLNIQNLTKKKISQTK